MAIYVVYVCMCMCIHIHIYVYICIFRIKKIESRKPDYKGLITSYESELSSLITQCSLLRNIPNSYSLVMLMYSGPLQQCFSKGVVNNSSVKSNTELEKR